MITTRFTAEAEAAAQRYGLLVDSWRALYNRTLDQGVFTASVFGRVQTEAYDIARRYLAGEAEQIGRASLDIALEAQGATLRALSVTVADELADDAAEHVSEADSYLQHELSVQIERDIAFLLISLRRAALQINLAARAANIPVRAALMQYRIGNAQELQFFFHNRGNAKWPSRKFVRAVWRHHLLAVYNETVLMTLADHGIDTAQVVSVDPKNDANGMRISMSANSSLPTYAEIRNEVFHPNANSILAKVA